MESDNPNTLPSQVSAELVDSVGVGIGVYSENGEFIYVNQRYADLFNTTTQELIGERVWELNPELDSDEFREYWNSFENGETRKAETVHRYNNCEIPVATITTQHSIDNKIYHFETIKNIKQRKQKGDKIIQKNKQLQNVIKIASHDLRNPLNIAQGYIEALQGELDRSELEPINNALVRMETLTSELLHLAQTRDIGEISTASLRHNAEQAWENIITRQAELSLPTENEQVLANETRLKQMFQNIFRNAIEHGGDSVTVTVDTTTDGFYIADDGAGIPANERSNVFKTGYSLNEGTGIGLTIVQQVVTEHDWNIHVGESPEGGARFEITDVEYIT